MKLENNDVAGVAIIEFLLVAGIIIFAMGWSWNYWLNMELRQAVTSAAMSMLDDENLNPAYYNIDPVWQRPVAWTTEIDPGVCVEGNCPACIATTAAPVPPVWCAFQRMTETLRSRVQRFFAGDGFANLIQNIACTMSISYLNVSTPAPNQPNVPAQSSFGSVLNMTHSTYFYKAAGSSAQPGGIGNIQTLIGQRRVAFQSDANTRKFVSESGIVQGPSISGQAVTVSVVGILPVVFAGCTAQLSLVTFFGQIFNPVYVYEYIPRRRV